LDELKKLTTAHLFYVSVHPSNEGIEVFYGVPFDGSTTLEIEYIKSSKAAVFREQGHIDFLYNQVWQSIEQQIAVTLDYKKNDYYLSLLPLNLDFDSDYTKMTFVLPIQ